MGGVKRLLKTLNKKLKSGEHLSSRFFASFYNSEKRARVTVQALRQGLTVGRNSLFSSPNLPSLKLKSKRPKSALLVFSLLNPGEVLRLVPKLKLGSDKELSLPSPTLLFSDTRGSLAVRGEIPGDDFFKYSNATFLDINLHTPIHCSIASFPLPRTIQLLFTIPFQFFTLLRGQVHTTMTLTGLAKSSLLVTV